MGTFPKNLKRSDRGHGTRGAVWRSLKIKDSTYIFQVDVRVLWVVWVSVPGPIIWCSAPAVPVLMLTTVGYGTRLQRKTTFIAQMLACRSGCLPTYFIMLYKRLSSRNTVIVFIIINHQGEIIWLYSTSLLRWNCFPDRDKPWKPFTTSSTVDAMCTSPAVRAEYVYMLHHNHD